MVTKNKAKSPRHFVSNGIKSLDITTSEISRKSLQQEYYVNNNHAINRNNTFKK